jgi:4-carboxymuconolactone decarboxylase
MDRTSSVEPNLSSRPQAVNADDKRARAEEIRQTLWGPDHADRVALLRRFEPDLAEIVMVEGFGGIYADDRLSLRERNLCTIASLATQGKAHQLRSHLQAALRIGFTPEQLSAVFAHLFIYAGLPTVIEGLRTLEELLGEHAGTSGDTSPDNGREKG